MASLDMKGPFELSTSIVDSVITQTSPGNYALGFDRDSTFIVKYVGRSDNDVNKRVKDWVGENSSYKQFKFSYSDSPKAAFEKECKNYHDFGGKGKLDNKEHPQRPAGSTWKCPVCTLFD